MNVSPSDLRVQGAFNNTSMLPEDRERQHVREYMRHMAEVEAEFEPWRTDENLDQLDDKLEAYREQYTKKLNDYFAAHSGIVSQFIVGPSGWTTSQINSQRRKNETADRRLSDLNGFSEARLNKLRRMFDPKRIANAPISADNPNAITLLQVKIDKAVRFQDGMKQANRICKGKKTTDTEKITTLMTALEISEATAKKILAPDFAGRIGFPSYALTNNNANIKRMRSRIKELQAAATQVSTETQIGDITYRENTEANRVQFLFPGKPNPRTRTLLKARGFRWAPSIKAWQRQLTPAGICAGKYILEYVTEHGYD